MSLTEVMSACGDISSSTPRVLGELSLLNCPGAAFPSEQGDCSPAGPLLVCVPCWVLDQAQQQQRALTASPAQEPVYDIFDSFWVLQLVLSESWPTHSGTRLWDMP